MEPEPATDKPAIRLPLPGYAKWAVRVWILLFLASPLLVFLRIPALRDLVLAAVLGGFLLPVFLGRLPGELEDGFNGLILLNPRSHRYPWFALLGRDSLLTSRPRPFPVLETRFRWEADRLVLATRDGEVLLGRGSRMAPVRRWLEARGIQPVP